MKKIIFVFIFTMMNQFVFSQSEAMQFLSMGFNAQLDFRGDTNYYFYVYDDYSEALIFDTFIELSTGKPGGFFPNGLIEYGFGSYEYRRYNDQNNSIGYYWYVPTQGTYGREYKFENGKLVYWAQGEGLGFGGTPDVILKRAEQNNQSLTIYYNEVSDDNKNYSQRYYNISRTELLDIFLKKYVELILDCIKMMEYENLKNLTLSSSINLDTSEISRLPVTQTLRGRTARELAIFRNCLFAMKGYKFSNSTWTEFFSKYLDDYNGQYTNDEVTAMFTYNERWVLDLIIQFENGNGNIFWK
jgi:hypothetical protein